MNSHFRSWSSSVSLLEPHYLVRSASLRSRKFWFQSDIEPFQKQNNLMTLFQTVFPIMPWCISVLGDTAQIPFRAIFKMPRLRNTFFLLSFMWICNSFTAVVTDFGFTEIVGTNSFFLSQVLISAILFCAKAVRRNSVLLQNSFLYWYCPIGYSDLKFR